MDEKKILIINLSKGLVGETNMRLLGSMLTTRIFLGAMSRADTPADKLSKLPHFYFYVDEFQNFANETFAEILSEARKYKLNLVIAHQYIEQMEEEVRDAVFGNVGTTVVFRVGPFDAEVLETVFMPRFTKEDIVSLDKRQVYMTLMIDGVGSAPFSAVTIPPIEAPTVSHREAIIAASREQFSAPREGIEKSIVDELMVSAAAEAPLDARMKRKPPMQRAPASPSMHREEERRPFVPHTPHPKERDSVVRTPERTSAPRSTPTMVTKGPDDLKAILRSMATATSSEREQKQSKEQQSLKGALADVLSRGEPQKPAEQKRSEAAMPNQKSPLPPKEEKQPFEVPEDALRKVLRGES